MPQYAAGILMLAAVSVPTAPTATALPDPELDPPPSARDRWGPPGPATAWSRRGSRRRTPSSRACRRQRCRRQRCRRPAAAARPRPRRPRARAGHEALRSGGPSWVVRMSLIPIGMPSTGPIVSPRRRGASDSAAAASADASNPEANAPSARPCGLRHRGSVRAIRRWRSPPPRAHQQPQRCSQARSSGPSGCAGYTAVHPGMSRITVTRPRSRGTERAIATTSSSGTSRPKSANARHRVHLRGHR